VLALGRMPLAADAQAHRLLQLQARDILNLFAQLNEGKRLVFSSVLNAQASSSYGAAARSAAPIFRVIVEPSHFVNAYKKYVQCIAQLIPYSFNELARSVFYYPTADAATKSLTELSAATKTKLDKIVRYLKADPKVLGLIIDAHSDKGASLEAGQEQSKVQAELVGHYLQKAGIAPEKITLRWHGERFPIASNATLDGRAKNRRVTLRLENAATRREHEKKMADAKAAKEKIDKESARLAAAQAASANVPNVPVNGEVSSKDLIGGEGMEPILTPEQLAAMVEAQVLTSTSSAMSSVSGQDISSKKAAAL
jgi:sodium-type flagellar protein MotY